MKIWIDGDSCPRQALDIVLRTGLRRKIGITVVADRIIPAVGENEAEMIVLPHGSGEVDDYISASSSAGDIVLTRDFALGIRLLENGVIVLNDRGRVWTVRELEARIEDSEMMKALRNGGITKKSRRGYDSADSSAFAASLEGLLNKLDNN